jgi:hypothetical protein
MKHPLSISLTVHYFVSILHIHFSHHRKRFSTLKHNHHWMLVKHPKVWWKMVRGRRWVICVSHIVNWLCWMDGDFSPSEFHFLGLFPSPPITYFLGSRVRIFIEKILNLNSHSSKRYCQLRTIQLVVGKQMRTKIKNIWGTFYLHKNMNKTKNCESLWYTLKKIKINTRDCETSMDVLM